MNEYQVNGFLTEGKKYELMFKAVRMGYGLVFDELGATTIITATKLERAREPLSSLHKEKLTKSNTTTNGD